MMDDANWLPWTIGVSIVFPLAIVVLGELAHRIRDRSEKVAEILLMVRVLILPSIAVFVFLLKVLQQEGASFGVRISETLMWIFVIHVGLLCLNAFLFQDSSGDTPKSTVPKLFRDLVRFVLVGIGAAIVLSTVWGTDLGGLMAALGVGSIVIGLALQDTLGNLMSGIAMLFERPFNEGDFVQIGDDEGWVTETNWRSVRLRTRTGDMLVLPNSFISNETIRNLSQPKSEHAELVTLGFSYNDPPNEVKAALLETAVGAPGVLATPAPDVRTVNYNDSSIDYEVLLWMKSPDDLIKVRNAFMTRIWYMAKRHGFTIPFPIRTVEMTPPEAPEDPRVRLAAVRGFRKFDDDQLQRIVDHSEFKSFGDGEELLTQGAKRADLHWIISGSVSLESTNVGITMPIASLEAGEGIGQESLLRGESVMATAIATSDVEVLVMPPEIAHEFLELRPDLAREMDGVTERRRELIAAEAQSVRHLQRAMRSSNFSNNGGRS